MSYLNQTILIEHLSKGKEEAFIYLVDSYNERLYAYALTLSRDEAMAQDIIQNVFLRTWEKRKKINITSSLQNYLFKSVRNEFLNLYKKKKNTMPLEQRYFESLEKVTSDHDEHSFKKAMDRITSEIQNLPPKCKEVFLLSRKEGLTNIEISVYLKISTKTVEAHITKAFSILREKLGDKLESILFMLFGFQRTLKK
ncbi:MAG: RNA polymerase sigma-70 factor [Bacteroidota bacterium]